MRRSRSGSTTRTPGPNTTSRSSTTRSSAARPLFAGEIITGVREVDYAVDPIEAGAYFFRCIVHPNMTGEMQAEESGPGEPAPGGPGAGPTVVAQDIAFNTSTIELPPAPTTITFENRDAGVQHNIAIYSDSSLADELFNGELVTGPTTVQYEVPALPPGDLYFQCVVHPNMSGTVVVSDAAGGGWWRPAARADRPVLTRRHPFRTMTGGAQVLRLMLVRGPTGVGRIHARGGCR